MSRQLPDALDGTSGAGDGGHDVIHDLAPAHRLFPWGISPGRGMPPTAHALASRCSPLLPRPASRSLLARRLDEPRADHSPTPKRRWASFTTMTS